jgi:radical SAM protein with 4Fe4S-binding SPASM domain
MELAVDTFKPFPSVGYLGLSYLCNMRCDHCYALEQPRSKHLKLEEVTRLIDDLSDLFCCTLIFGHGEPFLYKAFFDVLAHAKSRGMNTVIMTNGSVIDDAVAERLTDERVSPYRLYLSLDHCEEERHDAQRRVPGAFKMAVQAIKLLRSKGLDARISSTINVAAPRPADMWVRLCDELGVPGISLLTIRNKDRYTRQQVEAYAETLRDLVALTQKRPDLEILLHDPLIFRFVDATKLPRELYEKLYLENKCTAGVERIAIQPDGTVTTCNLVDGPILGNIREKSIKEIWDTSPYLARIQGRHTADSLAGCEGCQGYDECRGGCPAFSTESENDLVRDARCDALDGGTVPGRRTLPIVKATGNERAQASTRCGV